MTLKWFAGTLLVLVAVIAVAAGVFFGLDRTIGLPKSVAVPVELLELETNEIDVAVVGFRNRVVYVQPGELIVFTNSGRSLIELVMSIGGDRVVQEVQPGGKLTFRYPEGPQGIPVEWVNGDVVMRTGSNF